MAAVEFAAVGGQLFDEVEVACDFVAVAVEDERGVVAVLLEDGPHFTPEKVVARFVRFGVLAPHGHFDFEVDAVPVGHAEGRCRGTPRMETHVIHAVVLQDEHDTLPLGVVERGVSRFGEHGVLDGSAQVERPSVEQDVVAALRHFAQAERCRFFVLVSVFAGMGEQGALHGVEIGVEFVPAFGVFSQRNGFGEADFRCVAADGHFLGYAESVARDGE